jgi:hypothetical protein
VALGVVPWLVIADVVGGGLLVSIELVCVLEALLDAVVVVVVLEDTEVSVVVVGVSVVV